MSSFGLFSAATIHTGMAGTHATNWLYRGASAFLVAGVVFLSVYRIVHEVPIGVTSPRRRIGGSTHELDPVAERV